MPTPAQLNRVLRQRESRAHIAPKNGVPRRPSFRLRKSVRGRELADFTRQLATMVSARLPLVNSLEIVARQQSNPQFNQVLQSLLSSLRHGRSLSASLAQHPRLFTPLFVNVVHVGEVTGSLATMLQELATYLEKAGELKRKLLTAMAYPAVILLVAIGALSFLLFGIMPTFTDLFREFGTEPPLPTRVLLGTSDFLRAHFVYLVVLILGMVVLVKAFVRTPKGAVTYDRIKIRLPLIGTLVKKVLLARFARTLGTLLGNGISLLEALEITSESLGNLVFREQVRRMKTMASKGEALEKATTDSKLFPPLVVQMIAVGEETAELPTMLAKVAEFYESEVDAAIDTMTSIIEPVIIVMLGLVLGGAIVGIYLQIFEVMNVIQ